MSFDVYAYCKEVVAMDEFIGHLVALLPEPSIVMDALAATIVASDGRLTNEYLSTLWEGKLLQDDTPDALDDACWEGATRIRVVAKSWVRKFDPFGMGRHNCYGWVLLVSQSGRFAVWGFRDPGDHRKHTLLAPVSLEKVKLVCSEHPQLVIQVTEYMQLRQWWSPRT